MSVSFLFPHLPSPPTPTLCPLLHPPPLLPFFFCSLYFLREDGWLFEGLYQEKNDPTYLALKRLQGNYLGREKKNLKDASICQL